MKKTNSKKKIPYMRKYKIKGNYWIEVEATNKRDAESHAQQLITLDRKHYSIKSLNPTLSTTPKKTIIGKVTKWKK